MPTGPERDDHLDRVVLFADLAEAERQQLLEQHRLLSFAADQLLLLEQDASQGLLLIGAGLAKVRSFGVGGDEVVLSLLGPGDICGEMAVLHAGRRIADVVTLTPCEVLILRAGPFRRLLDTSPALCLALARLEVQRLQSLSRRLTLRTADATTRMLAVLLDLACHSAPGADATASIPPCPSVSWLFSPVWPGKRPHGPSADCEARASWRTWTGAVGASSIWNPCSGADCCSDELVFDDVVAAHLRGQGEIAALQLPHQLHQIEGPAPVAAGLHHHVAPGIRREVGIAPALQAVEAAAVGHGRRAAGAGPGVGAAGGRGGRGVGGVGKHHAGPGMGRFRRGPESSQGRGGQQAAPRAELPRAIPSHAGPLRRS